MIPANVITAWGVNHEWPTREQVEQDLLLSRAICEIAAHEYLGNELVFRGGTALHKLLLPRPYRYSEDLDYVRASGGGIGPVTTALTALGSALNFIVSTQMSEQPKVYWRTTADSGVRIRIKVEINTHERSPALPTTTIAHRIDTAWWSGEAEVPIFQPAELVATKIRALYQRSKGRDIFDLWLGLNELNLDPSEVLAAFAPYRPTGLTAARAIENLNRKLQDASFRNDLNPLVSAWPDGYDIDAAGEQVAEVLLAKL